MIKSEIKEKDLHSSAHRITALLWQQQATWKTDFTVWKPPEVRQYYRSGEIPSPKNKKQIEIKPMTNGKKSVHVIWTEAQKVKVGK